MLPAALDPQIKFFFVDEALDVKTLRGESHCSLSQGDALHLDALPGGTGDADLLVESSEQGDCSAGAHVLVAVRDLQAMSNHCHESLSAAAAQLSGGTAAKGLPAPPPSGARAGVSPLPPTELARQGQEVSGQIQQQQQQSAKLEADTRQDLETSLQ